AVVPGPAVVRRLAAEGFTPLSIPPSALAMLPEAALPRLGTIILVGEAGTAELVARWAGGRRFFNAYGPTEATVYCAICECRDAGRKPPIGRPIANNRIYLLDAAGGLVPIGV